MKKMTLMNWCLDQNNYYKNYRWSRPDGQLILGPIKTALILLPVHLLTSEGQITKKGIVLPTGDKFTSF